MIFYGTIDKGKLELINRQRFQDFIYTLNGSEVEVWVDKRTKKRTDRSNRYYWAYLHIIEGSTGDDANSLHQHFKKTLLPSKFEFLKSVNREVEIPKSTTSLTTIEFSEYIKKIEVLTEIPAPDPNELN